MVHFKQMVVYQFMSAVIGDNVKLLSDEAVLSLGAGSDALTHDGTTGLTTAATPALTQLEV